MTITEQLQFSVLTAPVAAFDRRALSQAWYSALYGWGDTSAGSGPPSTSLEQAAPLAATHAQSGAVRSEVPPREPALARRLKTPVYAQGLPPERRAPRSPLARKIERAILRPRSAARKSSFTVEGAHGRVHVLLQSRGAQLKLVAICPPKARAHVAAALAQARYALALRGIDLDADARGTVQC